MGDGLGLQDEAHAPSALEDRQEHESSLSSDSTPSGIFSLNQPIGSPHTMFPPYARPNRNQLTGLWGILKELISKELSAWLAKYQKLAALAGAFILFLVLHFMKDVTSFPYDAGDYWDLSALGTLLHFPDDIRGYFYPALLALPRFLSDTFPVLGHAPYRVVSSAAFAYVFAVLLPDFYHSVFGGQLGFWRRLVVPALVAALFPGQIVYILSDIPALALMLGAIACILHSRQCGDRRLGRHAFLVLGGILAYGAYNTRTIYLFPLMLAIAAVALLVYRDRLLKIRALATAAFLIGMLIASTPQALINKEHHGVLSPAVIADSNGSSLFAKQLLWGITVQRYETFIGWTPHGARRVYMDPDGAQLFDANKLGDTPFSVADYLRLVPKHPLDFLGIYGRHIVNGLDVRDGDEYLTQDSGDRNGLAAFNFLVVFSGLTLMLIALARNPPTDRRNAERLFWVFLVLLPVFAVIPGAIETRFFLPLDVAIYSTLAFGSDLSAIKALFKQQWPVLIVALGLSAAVFFSVSTATMASLNYNYPSIYRGK